MSCGAKAKERQKTCGRGGGTGNFKSLDEAIADYKSRHRDAVSATKVKYQSLDEDDALAAAASFHVLDAAGTRWKRHPHFHRPWLYKKQFVSAMATAGEILQQNKAALLNASQSGFEAVHACVAKLLEKVGGLGSLAYYDMTELLGYGWKFEPKFVHLHAGTRKGAEHLFGSKNCSHETLPPPFVEGRFQDLRPSEIEDFLCIYSDDLKKLRSRGFLPAWSFS